MSKYTFYFSFLLLSLMAFQPGFSQIDQIEGENFQFDVPQNIKSLQQQIKIAEDNENWDLYYSLRSQIIEAWQLVNPQVASLYKNVDQNQMSDSSPLVNVLVNPTSDNTMMQPFWAQDLLVHSGYADDISMVAGYGDTLYLGVLSRYFGSTTDSIHIYRSVDAGLNWAIFIASFFPTQTEKIELMDFNTNNTGPSYLLLFYKYISGRLWCTRYTPTGSATHSTVADSVGDFAIDRNWPGTNYRVMVMYSNDSTGSMRAIRSDPASYASVWQDDHSTGTVGVDVDFAYGYLGNCYTVFNGRNSGNLYTKSNYSYLDPTSWATNVTIENGTTDTTFAAEIIATRQDTAVQTVLTVYNWLNNGRDDLRTSVKSPGNSWSTPTNWSSFVSTENKFVDLYCKRNNSYDIFQSSFTRTGLNNIIPREVRYRKYSSGSWNTSTQRSDSSTSVTGTVGSSVAELENGTAVLAFVGVNAVNVYFDNEAWVTDVTPENLTPESYSLQQNYPNPFNPNTKINFNIPEQTIVKLKIFNAIGQEVAILLNSELAAGYHSFDFNAASLSSGVYFYRIETPNFTSTKKMILMK